GGTVMKRTSMIFIAALMVWFAAPACTFTAGVNNTKTGGAGTRAAGTGAAGTLGPTGVAGGNPFTGNGGQGGSSVFPPKPCEGLQCAQSTCQGPACTTVCPAGARTTVSGTIYDPAG